MYSRWRAHHQQHHRGKARAPKVHPKATHHATAPGQVWVWDITWMPTKIKGMFYRLYVIMDLFSRKIVAWEVWEEENDQRARELLRKAALSEGIRIDQGLVLHGDNGSPLKSANLHGLLVWLGIIPSYPLQNPPPRRGIWSGVGWGHEEDLHVERAGTDS
jgi:transposase InsO family protein